MLNTDPELTGVGLRDPSMSFTNGAFQG